MFITTVALSRAQDLTAINETVNVNELPNYIIISSQKSAFFGDIAIIIDTKNSLYKDKLDELESLLQNRKKLKIRNQGDLLNAMDALGFDYVDSYNETETDSYTNLDKTARKFRVNMIFRKKEHYRK
ncbi:hypothetical protein ACQY1Q_15500 [Tenacibaculum sp. TC6]